ncbi:unnamed protein product [Rhizophagus irregularis]|nr:unnamed protein product [Rhizophagus irregularis]
MLTNVRSIFCKSKTPKVRCRTPLRKQSSNSYTSRASTSLSGRTSEPGTFFLLASVVFVRLFEVAIGLSLILSCSSKSFLELPISFILGTIDVTGFHFEGQDAARLHFEGPEYRRCDPGPNSKDQEVEALPFRRLPDSLEEPGYRTPMNLEEPDLGIWVLPDSHFNLLRALDKYRLRFLDIDEYRLRFFGFGYQLWLLDVGISASILGRWIDIGFVG